MPMNNNHLDDLLTILCDPADPAGELAYKQGSSLHNGTLVSHTDKVFDISNDIPDMFCPAIEPPDHTPVSDEEWEAWKKLQATVFSEFTYSGGLSGATQELGHQAAVKCAPKVTSWILEIGSGISHHFLKYGQQYPQTGRYINLDANFSNLTKAKDQYTKNNQKISSINTPSAYFVRGSAYNLPFRNQSIDHVIAIYVFEHLKHLKRAISELLRVVAVGGSWCIVLPTEGGLAWKLGRKLMYSRQIKKRYGINYDRMIAIEHCNTCVDVIEAACHFTSCQITYLPFAILPTPHINAVVMLHSKAV